VKAAASDFRRKSATSRQIEWYLNPWQWRPKAPPPTQNASQKSLGDENKEVKVGDKIYLFASMENKRIKPLNNKQFIDELRVA